MDELIYYHQRIAYLLANTPSISQAELARRLGIAQQSVNYLATKAKGSTHNSKIAQIFGVNPIWLETGKGPKEPSIGNSIGSYECPIVEWEELALGIRGDSKVIEHLVIDSEFGMNTIGARYFGSAMCPPITNGSYIVINYGDEAISQAISNASRKEYNLVVIQQGGEISLKNLTKEGSALHLSTTTRQEEQKLNPDTDKILGQVVFSIFKM